MSDAGRIEMLKMALLKLSRLEILEISAELGCSWSTIYKYRKNKVDIGTELFHKLFDHPKISELILDDIFPHTSKSDKKENHDVPAVPLEKRIDMANLSNGQKHAMKKIIAGDYLDAAQAILRLMETERAKKEQGK